MSGSNGHRPIRVLEMLVVSAIARAEVPFSALWRKARTGETRGRGCQRYGQRV
jgi:hypothetical protein